MGEQIRPGRARRRLRGPRRGEHGDARLRRARGAGRARALGRQLPERRLLADEGLPRRGRAGARRQLRARPCSGSRPGPARVDLARVRAWKESLKKSQEQWVRDLEGSGFATVTGQATFTGPHTVRVGERELEADRILIATGSRTAVPPVEGIEEIDWLDHVSALDLTEVPRSLLVVGAGAVGLEFGQAFSRFGAQVRIVDAAERIAPLADAEASATLAAALAGRRDRARDERLRPARAPGRRRGGGDDRPARRLGAVRAARPEGAARLRPRARTSRSSTSRRPASRRRRPGSRWTSTCAPRCPASGPRAT